MDNQREEGIKQILRCSLEETNNVKGYWPSKLKEVAYVYKSSPNASTGFSPYQVMYASESKTLGYNGYQTVCVLRTVLRKGLPTPNYQKSGG